MRQNNIIRSSAFLLVLLLLVLGVIHLFLLRFEIGDVYPAYSSLRSDPLGSRLLYESLKNFDHIVVHRNYRALRSLIHRPGTTFLYLGAPQFDHESLPEEFVRDLDRVMQAGGRLVLSFLPVNETAAKKTTCEWNKNETAAKKASDGQIDTDCGQPEQTGEDETPMSDQKGSGSPEQKDPDPTEILEKCKRISLKTHWGVAFDVNENLSTTSEDLLDIVAVSQRVNLPSSVSWHTMLYFDLLDSSWQVLYACQGKPVIVERPFGKGSIVLCADSFFISNEALWSERYPQLLAWLIGKNSTVVFDESHFGISKQPSVAGLIRQYRFHWFFVSLAVMALLFVWKNAVYFVPPPKDAFATGVEVVSEKDYTQGLVALLRRNIAAGKILQVCAGEWEQTFKKDRRVPASTFEHISGIIKTASNSSKRQTDYVQRYRTISRIIAEDKGYE